METFFDWSNPLLAIAMLGGFAVMVIGLEVASSGDRRVILSRGRLERRRMATSTSRPPGVVVAAMAFATLAAFAGIGTIAWNWFHGVDSPQWLFRWSTMLGALVVGGDRRAMISDHATES